MPVAAIEALVELLAQSQASTISETLDLLATSTAHLKAAIPNPISLSAGTDLFQRYLITTLQRPSSSNAGATIPFTDFRTIRQHLISNGRLFVTRAKASRDKIAAFGRHFVRDGNTVLTNGGSRVVGALLQHAADDSKGSIRFRVIYVLGHAPDFDPNGTEPLEGTSTISALREKGIPVAVIPESAVGYALGKVDSVIVGAEGVVENGGIISRLGTYQMGLLARAAGKPFYVVAESHKFVRLYPLGQYDLPIEQRVVQFETNEQVEKDGYFDTVGNGVKDAVDFTPPDLISALITESGVLTPSAVSEELIKIWF
ncbi:MAG: translation initiation factor eIF-2B subunit alpha [Piccolia ochrophora]|nr:MAG: translation initiation factor eIF-2B subunit alpha [Piccolia ochrophora]